MIKLRLYDHLLSKEYTKYSTPRDFLAAAVEYFKWADSTPLQKEEVNVYKGEITRYDVNQMRAYTKEGLALYLNMPASRLESYKSRKDEEWSEAVEMVEMVMREQKFTGAAGGLLNAALVGRDLGLADRQELTGKDGGPLQTEEVGNAAQKFASRMAALMARNEAAEAAEE